MTSNERKLLMYFRFYKNFHIDFNFHHRASLSRISEISIWQSKWSPICASCHKSHQIHCQGRLLWSNAVNEICCSLSNISNVDFFLLFKFSLLDFLYNFVRGIF